MSIITKEAVTNALPTLKNIPIVGEFNEAIDDFKGHGGAIDLDSYKFIHTTKPYGVVPESATYEWEEVKGRDGTIREYLTIHDCYLWTGRYEEAQSVIENGKGQSMEIEVTDGFWNEDEEAYQIDGFVFSALCILGDDVEPAFEDASIVAYSLDKDTFKQEFTAMLDELKSSLSQEKGVNATMLKELLEKYSLTVEDLTAKGIDFNEITEDELEAKIIEVFEIDVNDDGAEGQEGKADNTDNEGDNADNEGDDAGQDNDNADDNDAGDNTDNDDADNEGDDEGDNDDDKDDKENDVDVEALYARIAELECQLEEKDVELNSLREFKLNVEKSEHESKVTQMFKNFQLTEEDVEGIEIHEFSLEEIEEKCYAILGRKLAKKKNFSKINDDKGIKLPIDNKSNEDSQPSPYGDLFEKYKD